MKHEFYRWESVMCKKKDGREILALYQYSVGLAHCVWDGEHQFLIKSTEEIRPATLEEDTRIRNKVEQAFNGLFKTISVAKVLKDKAITQNPKRKTKAQTDFELITASIDDI